MFLFIIFNTFLGCSNFSGFVGSFSLALMKAASNNPTGITIVTSKLVKVVGNSTVTGITAAKAVAVPLVGQAKCGDRFTNTIRTITSANKRFAPPVVKTINFIVTRFLGLSCARITLTTIAPTLLCCVNLLLTIRFRTGQLKLSKVTEKGVPSTLSIVGGRKRLILPLIDLVKLVFAKFAPLCTTIVSVFVAITTD